MAIPASAFSTYGVGFPYSGIGVSASNIATREDAMNTLTMIDPDEAMTLAVLAKTTTNGLRHEWFIDSLAVTNNTPAIQGEDWGQTATVTNVKSLNPRVRLSNFVEFRRQDWSIT